MPRFKNFDELKAALAANPALAGELDVVVDNDEVTFYLPDPEDPEEKISVLKADPEDLLFTLLYPFGFKSVEPA